MEGLSYVSVIRGLRALKEHGADLPREQGHSKAGGGACRRAGAWWSSVLVSVYSQGSCALWRGASLRWSWTARCSSTCRASCSFDNLKLVHKDFFECRTARLPASTCWCRTLRTACLARPSCGRASIICRRCCACRRNSWTTCWQSRACGTIRGLACSHALQMEVERIRDVDAGNFYPRPKVDSCIIRIRPIGTVEQECCRYHRCPDVP